MRDALKILGLRKGATPDEIKASYRRLVRLHHPDVATDKDEATRRMSEINGAFTYLTTTGSERPANDGWEPESADFWKGKGTFKPRPKDVPLDEDLLREAFIKFGWGQRVRGAKGSTQAQQDQAKADPVEPAPEPSKDLSLKTPCAGTATSAAMNPEQAADLINELIIRARREAFSLTVKQNDGNYSMFNGRAAVRVDQMPGLHTCDAISVDGRTLRIYLRTAAQVGRNIIALPDFVQHGATLIEQLPSVRIVNINRTKPGAQVARLSIETGLIKDGQDIAIEVHFGSEASRVLDMIRDKTGYVRFRAA